MSPHTLFDLSASSLEQALATLESGDIVVCPTDTIYGLLVDATNEDAVKKLIAFKERPVGKAISVFVDGLDMMEKYVEAHKIPPASKSLLPGPYTFVLPSLHRTSKLLESEKGTLGVRYIGNKSAISNMQSTNNVNANSQIQSSQSATADKSSESADQVPSNDQDPNSNVHTLSSQLEASQSNDVIPPGGAPRIYPALREAGISPADFVTTLVSMFGRPVTATSANLAGKSSCHSIQALLRQLSPRKLSQLDLLIDTGELPHNPPSTVLDLTSPTPQVLRGTGAETVQITRSPEETMDVAEDFITVLLSAHRSQLSTTNSQFIVYLHGDLGAGKTHFVKGIARHFGFDRITSPTYLGMQEYKNEKGNLYHVDLYNFESAEDVSALGLDKLCVSLDPRVREDDTRVSPVIPSPDCHPGEGRDPSYHTVIPGLSRDLIHADSSIRWNDTSTVIPTIICIEWSEVAQLTYPGTHVYMEYGGETERKIRISPYQS